MGSGRKIMTEGTGHWSAGPCGHLAVLLLGSVVAGGASGQTLTGTLADAGDYFRFPESDFAVGQGVVFRLRTSEGGGLGLSFTQEPAFSYRFGLFRTQADMTQPIALGVTVDELASEQWIWDGAPVLDFQVSLQAGEDLTLVLTCQGTCEPELSFAFDVIGAAPLTFGPDAAVELASLVAASSGMDRLVVLDAQRVARDMGAVSLALRRAVPVGDPVAVASKSATPVLIWPGLVGSVHSWAQVTGFDSSAGSGPGGLTGTGFQVGADLAIGTDMVAGLSLGHASLTATDGTTRQEGGLTYLQPYVAWHPGPWHGHASLIYGRGDYDQTSISGAGAGETDLLAITFEGGFDRPLAPALTLTPTLALVTGRETVTGTSGTLAAAGTHRVDFAQTSLGARLTYLRPAGVVFAGLHADYLTQGTGAVLADGFLSEDGWTGRVEIGGSVDLGPGLGLATSVDLGGLGGAAQTLSGGVQLSLKF